MKRRDGLQTADNGGANGSQRDNRRDCGSPKAAVRYVEVVYNYAMLHIYNLAPGGDDWAGAATAAPKNAAQPR